MATIVWFSSESIEQLRGEWRDPRNLLISDEQEGLMPNTGVRVRVVTDSHGQVESSSAVIGSVERHGDIWNVELNQLTPFVRDRRTFERYEAAFKVEIVMSSGERIRAKTCNVSASGIFVVTDLRPTIGDILPITLDLEGEQLDLKAWVVRHDETLGGLGLEFLEVSPGSYLALAAHLSQLRNGS